MQKSFGSKITNSKFDIWNSCRLLDTKFAKRTISLYFVFVNFDDFSSTRSQCKKLSLKPKKLPG